MRFLQTEAASFSPYIFCNAVSFSFFGENPFPNRPSATRCRSVVPQAGQLLRIATGRTKPPFVDGQIFQKSAAWCLRIAPFVNSGRPLYELRFFLPQSPFQYLTADRFLRIISSMAKENFFLNLFASIFGSKDPEAAKKRLLKNISKTLSKSKFHFYKFASHEIDPSFAKYFYEIYKVISPAQVMFESTSPNALKNIVLNSAMTDQQKELADSFTKENLLKEAQGKKVEEYVEEVYNRLQNLTAQFSEEKIIKIDTLYTKLILFKNFIQFDYYFMLKKFDASLRERNFTSTPRFQSINGTYILEDIKNFISVAWPLPLDWDWEDMFKLVKSIKGVEPLAYGTWKKILNRIKNLRDKEALEMMIQLISEDPSYKATFPAEEYHIGDDYFSSLNKQVDEAVEEIKKKQAANKVEGIASQIFGEGAVTHLKYYTVNESDIFERKNLGSYMYCEPLGYVKTFLLNYVKKEIRELSDIILVRGDWSNPQVSKPMSESYHQLLEISEKITQLDEGLSEHSNLGMKLKTLLPRSERDRESRNIIQTTLRDINNAAATMIMRTNQHLITYARNLKMALEDLVKYPKSELVLNWRDLDKFAEGNLKRMCVDAYKKIYLLVQLLQNFPVQIDEG